ncbi:peptidase C39 family protein [Nocardioides daphniae]|uniref:peptidase C39 family protein n=1 Tax=Nocardioides daphniae TaxID=402297 RepID=UPI001E441358|nr:peptidase C39 family protein [Nocardioides daphniae]
MRPLLRTSRNSLATLLTCALGVTLAVSSVPAAQAGQSAQAARKKAETTQVRHTSFDLAADFARGSRSGAVVSGDAVRLRYPKATRKLGTTTYDVGTWTSPWVDEKFAFTELIPSWQAKTPGRSLVEVQVRLRTKSGTRTTTGSWDTVARWTKDNTFFKRTSLAAQGDDLARVAVDTVKANSSAGATGWQVKVVLMRRKGAPARPQVTRVGAMTSKVVARTTTSKPGKVVGTVIDVPRYSQMTHRGHHPEWGNGGEAWCSPTSTAMVLEHYGANPAAGHAFKSGHADAVVDWTAMQTYDHGYRGTGNWAFNAAHAGSHLRRTYVTRLADLRAAEPFIKAGTPLIVSVAFAKGGLRGAPISSTAGHLMVLVGFTAKGDVVVNDPAASSNAGVRRTYDRAQFEKAWLTKSGGLTYVYED